MAAEYDTTKAQRGMAGTDERDPYKILQIDPSAEPPVIEGAYKTLVKIYHPDVNPGKDTTAQMQDINWAHDLLGDPAKRDKYDRDRKLRAAKLAKPTGAAQPWQNARPATARPADTRPATNPPPTSGTKASGSTPGSKTGSSTSSSKTGSSTPGGTRPTGSSTWGKPPGSRPSDENDPFRQRPDSTPEWTRDSRPFARTARGEAATPKERGYQRPFERSDPAQPTGRYSRPSSPFTTSRDEPAPRRYGGSSTPAQDEPRAQATGRFSSARAAFEAERLRDTPAARSSTTARPAGSTRRRMESVSSDGAAMVKTVKTLLAELSGDWRKLAVLVVVGLALLLGLLNIVGGGDSDSESDSSAEITVPYGATSITGHWITIWGEAYRASIQKVVDEAALAANTTPPLVQLGGFVFADALNLPYGFYCPPTTTYNPTMTPIPPIVLDACMLVTLSPELSGYAG